MPTARTPRDAATSYPNDEVPPGDSEAVVTERGRPRGTAFRAAAAAAIVALAVVALAGFEIWLRTGGDTPEPADAVVVLGPGRDGERLERALALVGENLADTLVVSMGRGGQRADTDAVCAGEPTGWTRQEGVEVGRGPDRESFEPGAPAGPPARLSTRRW